MDLAKAALRPTASSIAATGGFKLTRPQLGADGNHRARLVGARPVGRVRYGDSRAADVSGDAGGLRVRAPVAGGDHARKAGSPPPKPGSSNKWPQTWCARREELVRLAGERHRWAWATSRTWHSPRATWASSRTTCDRPASRTSRRSARSSCCSDDIPAAELKARPRARAAAGPGARRTAARDARAPAGPGRR